MSSLQEICDTLLDNADLTLSVEGVSGLIKLEFHPAAFDGLITLYCADYSRLNFRKSPDDEDAIFVGEVNITIKKEIRSVAKLYKEDGWQSYNKELLKPVAHIEIEGGAMLSIVCEKLSWQKGIGDVQVVL
ncbi:hypothetical protein [Marinibactrum halimedae]|uniref:Uncharacterized protein n=1 Tax=Marinibactrum halimedae TaxID=1444977 RepID=A0AA37T400_9GAMM|nr:hypothetical protein [Marinibactrum halimedae]MCD9461389.1 hypothetical protein [Marinibactrum halimedae]GLS25186.1 hypothetical protein GCM10007877_09000 [Marinibactrum halimedae]